MVNPGERQSEILGLKLRGSCNMYSIWDGFDL